MRGFVHLAVHSGGTSTDPVAPVAVLSTRPLAGYLRLISFIEWLGGTFQQLPASSLHAGGFGNQIRSYFGFSGRDLEWLNLFG